MSKIEPKDEHKYLTQLSLSGCQCDKTSSAIVVLLSITRDFIINSWHISKYKSP